MKNKWLAALLALLMLLTMGCARKATTPDASYSSEPAAAAPMAMTEEAESYDSTVAYDEAGGAVNGYSEEKSAAEVNENNYGGRKIIRTLAIELRTDRFEEHVALIEKDTHSAGGYVQNSYIYGTKPEVAGDSGRSANFTLRIPVDKVDAFMNTASTYGTLLSQNEDSEDVTDSYFDIETRLKVSRTTLERLQNILVKTNNLSDIIELEQEIARVTVEIEELTTNLRKYDGLIQYATVNVSLYEEGMKIGPAAKTPFGQRVSDGFSETLSAVGNFLEDFAVVLLSALPVLLPIAAIVLLVLWLRRRRIRNDVKNGMPDGFVAWQRRAWRKEQRLIKKNGAAPMPAEQINNAQDIKQNNQEDEKHENQ